MDKSGFIQEHSKLKLELYNLYLERYLSVLSVASFFEKITIYDLFAGQGISENGEKGSAYIAAETIEKIKAQFQSKNKQVFLKLNDVNSDCCADLENHLKKFTFIEIANKSADQYIQGWKQNVGCHSLFFIDPYGYRQLTAENLEKLFGFRDCDFLIFVPIFHIYRFLRKEENAEQLKPIAEFLADLGIGETEAVGSSSPEDFAELVKGALQKKAKTDYVYSQSLKNQGRGSLYCLFFVTKHVLGAHKFIEAQNALKQKIKKQEAQASFDFVDSLSVNSILDYVEYDQAINNVQMYEMGIKAGLLPAELREQLQRLEANGKIVVKELPSKKRNQKGFYLDYKYYKEGDKIIEIIFKR